MITLSDGTTTVELNPDLLWSDEWAWSAVERTRTRSLTGARITQQGVKQGGRPITLTNDGPEAGLLTRGVLEQLQAWMQIPGKQLTLTLRGISRTVELESLQATPQIHFNDTDAGDYYLATVSMTEV